MAQRRYLWTSWDHNKYCVIEYVHEHARICGDIYIYIPEFGVVLGPKLASVFKRGTEDCEAFIPHELVEE